MKQKFYSPQELAEVLGVSPRTVINWINEGQVQATRYGIGRGIWRIPLEEVVRLVGYNPFFENEETSKGKLVADYTALDYLVRRAAA